MTESQSGRGTLVIVGAPRHQGEGTAPIELASKALGISIFRTSDFDEIMGATRELLFFDGSLGDVEGERLLASLRAAGVDSPVVFALRSLSGPVSFQRLTQELDVARVVVLPTDVGALAEVIREASGVTRWSGPVPVVQELDGSAEELDELYRAFADRLPERAQELATASERLLADPDDAAARRDVVELAHRLHGTAGSYGFEAVSDCALDAERAATSGDDSALESAVAQLVDEAGHALESAGRPGARAQRSAILVVDSDPEFHEKVRSVARHNFARVVTATSAKQALLAACRSPLGGALIEVGGGVGFDPLDLARDLRRCGLNARLPIAFMSAEPELSLRISAANAGGFAFLRKPVAEIELSSVLHELWTVNQADPPRVLIVDDDPDYARLVQGTLVGEGVRVEILNDPSFVLDVLEDFRPDLLLLDVMMPQLSGFDVCRLVRTSTTWRDIPILFVTGNESDDVRLSCFEAGGDDYINKGATERELLARVGVRLDRARLIKERTTRDPLTMLNNRRAFVEAFQGRIEQARRSGDELALCSIDIDRFKEVNDSHGHLAGDRVLWRFGVLTAARVRAYDLPARWGGEEFLIALYGADRDTASQIAERLLEAFRSVEFRGDSDESFHVSFSGGIAMFPEDGESLTALLRSADARLYRAKSQGRNQVVDS